MCCAYLQQTTRPPPETHTHNNNNNNNATTTTNTQSNCCRTDTVNASGGCPKVKKKIEYIYMNGSLNSTEMNNKQKQSIGCCLFLTYCNIYPIYYAFALTVMNFFSSRT